MHVYQDLATELKEIDARLKVKVCMESIILALDTFFAETSNYPKGCGDVFKSHMEEFHPNYLLYHVPSTIRNMQDIVCQRAGPACMNLSFCTEFHYKKLREYQKQNEFQENMFIALSSLATTSMLRVFSIIDTSIVMSMGWFTSNSHKLSKHG